ncbi:ABC transporter permease subunit [bacterium]|nr:ABC transporter permease subunit [bacterium]
MTNTCAVFKKEFKTYFNTPIAYIIITVFLLIINWLFFRGFFLVNQANMRSFFGSMPWIFLFFVPAITMRLWAEEKRSGAIELIMTLPLRDVEVILGKYFASLLFLIITISLTLSIPITVSYLGSPDMGPIIGGYLGIVFLGAAYLAIGSFISSLTKNQIIAFILSIAVCFGLFIVGENIVLMNIPYFLAPFLEYLGLGSHFASVSRGVIDSRDIVYYLSIVVFFIYLNIRSVESRKWR